MTFVIVSGLKLFAHHGVSEKERREGRTYRIHVELALDHCKCETSDDIRDTVDYGAITQLVAEITTDKQFFTVERVASEICDQLFERFASVRDVVLSIEKLNPPTPFPVESAGVKLCRSRE